jgi:hypothetical protein
MPTTTTTPKSYEVKGVEMPEVVQDWLREMCVIAPKVMERVTTMKFGNLGQWLQDANGDSVGGDRSEILDAHGPAIPIRGCLVGSTAMAFNEMMSCAVTPHWNKKTIQFILGEFIAKCIPELGLTKRNLTRVAKYNPRTPIEEALMNFISLTQRAGLAANEFAHNIRLYTYRENLAALNFSGNDLSTPACQQLAVKEFKKFIRDTLKELGN